MKGLCEYEYLTLTELNKDLSWVIKAWIFMYEIWLASVTRYNTMPDFTRSKYAIIQGSEQITSYHFSEEQTFFIFFGIVGHAV